MGVKLIDLNLEANEHIIITTINHRGNLRNLINGFLKIN